MRSVRSLEMVVIALSSAGLLACSDTAPAPEEAVEVRTGALVVNQANVFGFDSSPACR